MIAKWFVTGALAASVLTCRGVAQSPAELLEKGIYTQETVGDLDRAIEVYRQIVPSSPAARTYAAHAQYRLAQCLLQKGAKIEAAREFKKVIEVYPEEKELVEKARESLLPLAALYLEADYYDPVLGLSFTSPEWPVSQVERRDDGSVYISLTASKVGWPMVRARRSRMPSVEAWFDEYQKRVCTDRLDVPNAFGCRVLSTGEVKGWRVLRFLSGALDLRDRDGSTYVLYGVLMRGEKTELLISGQMRVQDLERNQAVIERIIESVRMP